MAEPFDQLDWDDFEYERQTCRLSCVLVTASNYCFRAGNELDGSENGSQGSLDDGWGTGDQETGITGWDASDSEAHAP